MTARSANLFFDYVDPLSYLVEVELTGLEDETGLESVARHGLELRTPPDELMSVEDPEWIGRWEAAVELRQGAGPSLQAPDVIPWSRKAHELVRHAASKGAESRAHHLVFDAFFRRGLDIGRVDVLVGLAEELGLEPFETKAVLDVDRYTADVEAGTRRAREWGIRTVPTLLLGDAVLEGFHKRHDLRTFLCSP